MNTELLLKVANAIEKYPELYDQETYGDVEVNNTSCGTTACIAGWACALEGYYPTVIDTRFSYEKVSKEPYTEYYDGLDTHFTAVSILGLDNGDAEELFSAYWMPRDDLTVPEALRKIANGASIEEVTG